MTAAFLGGALIAFQLLPGCTRFQPAISAPGDQQERVLLPALVDSKTNDLSQAMPIWVDTEPAQLHNIALFRHTVSTIQPLNQAELYIFADTRYSVWLDGKWRGRGPARFSTQLHEYDILPLGDLAPGEHTLGVLVQWAPNLRRSESRRPHLLAELRGLQAGETKLVAATGPMWRAVHAVAWRTDPAPIHEWGILGPTELVDLRKLPSDWAEPTFDDTGWDSAALVPVDPQPQYRPRSIPLLEDVDIAYDVLDTGHLSPGRRLIQIAPDGELEIALEEETRITVEIPVEAATGEPISATLDGGPVTWQSNGPARPDVVKFERRMDAGRHKLAFDSVPDYGLPVAIDPASSIDTDAALEQGTHGGRRLLLANAVADDDAVESELTTDKLGSTPTRRFRVSDGPAYLVLDLGRVVHGRLSATVLGPQGTVVDIGWDERLYQDSLRPLPHPGTLHPYWNQVDSWVLDGQPREITTIDARAGRYVLIALWGDGVVLDDVHVREERYPVVARGRFHSSNPRLDAIWQLGVNTAYPSMQDAYADAWRERGQWWGDAYVADHINQVAFGDSLLLRRGLRAIAAAADPDGNLPAFAPHSDSARLIDYGLLWVQSLSDYVERTGDIKLAQELFPTLQGYIAHLETLQHPDSGLLDAPEGHWSESALVDWAGQLSRHGQSTVLNALYAKSLRDAALVASLAGDEKTSKQWAARAEEIEREINRRLWLPSQARYASSILNGQIVTPTTHAQVWPLAQKVVPEERIDATAAAALDGFWVEIYGMFWALEGLGRAGYVDEAVALVEEQYGQLLDRGATTLWEHWDSDQRYDAALSHAWGGGATWFLSTYVLGARRTGPMAWEVRPAFAGVTWASGAIPLQTGVIDVKWEIENCSTRRLHIDSPQSSTGDVVLALDRLTRVTRNGEVIWRNGAAQADGVSVDDGTLRVTMHTGRADFALDLDCR